jgi:hypothetical protein
MGAPPKALTVKALVPLAESRTASISAAWAIAGRKKDKLIKNKKNIFFLILKLEAGAGVLGC